MKINIQFANKSLSRNITPVKCCEHILTHYSLMFSEGANINIILQIHVIKNNEDFYFFPHICIGWEHPMQPVMYYSKQSLCTLEAMPDTKVVMISSKEFVKFLTTDDHVPGNFLNGSFFNDDLGAYAQYIEQHKNSESTLRKCSPFKLTTILIYVLCATFLYVHFH